MLVDDLLDQLGQSTPPRVILFCPGKAPYQREPWEPVLAERAVQRITDTYVEPGMEDLAYTVYYADETKPADVVLEARTLPFLAERRVVLVRNAERYMGMSADRRSPLAPLLAYIKEPADSAILLLVSAQVDKRKALYKVCGESGLVVECPQLDDARLSRWIEDLVRGQGKRIGRGAVNEIIHRSGARLGDVNNAVNLVTGYVGEAEDIREEDVVAACADVAEETVWALTDAIAASEPERALEVLYQLSGFGKSPDEIIGIINWLLESAYRAAPESGVELKSRFVQRKVMPLVQKFGVMKLRAACALCTDTHFMTRTTGVDRMLALELLVIKLAYRPARRRAR